MWYCEGSRNNFIFYHTYCSCVMTKVQRYTIIYSLYSNYILGTCLQRRIVKLFPWRHGIALVLMPFFFSWYGIKLVLMFFPARAPVLLSAPGQPRPKGTASWTMLLIWQNYHQEIYWKLVDIKFKKLYHWIYIAIVNVLVYFLDWKIMK